jgi:hypothetical protein
VTELVGREEELELLLRRWSKAKTGEGQVVLLSGEAGIGKSRLTAALLERRAGEPHTRLRYFCSPQHTDSALYPVIGHMERAAALVHSDSPQVKLDKLDVLLARSSTSKQDAALFAEMPSLPNDGRYPVIDLIPEQRRKRRSADLPSRKADPAQSGADDLGRCALGRPDELGGVRSDCRSGSQHSRAADRDVPARVPSALNWTAIRHCTDDKPASGARH